MSTTTAAPYGATLDVSQTAKVPFSRLVRVELRKMVDTRAGMWLLIAIGVLTALGVIIFGLAASDDEKLFGNFMGFTGGIQGFLLPVLGILLVTQEWGQRTAMVTFTLEPHRSRVLSAKVAAASIVGVAAIMLAFAVAALATLAFNGTGGFNEVVPQDFLKFGILQATGVLQGLAFGLLFLSSAPAIVSYFVLPTVFSIIANVWSALQDAAPWIDLGTAQGALFDTGTLTGEEWAQVGITFVIWVVLPFAVGLWRTLRAEFK